jgi:hypothetical protein
MPESEYEARTDSVLAWKKAQKLGRFDPNAPSLEEQKIKTLEREVEERGQYLLASFFASRLRHRMLRDIRSNINHGPSMSQEIARAP